MPTASEATGIVAAIIIICEVIKGVVPNRYVPIVAVCLGVLAGVFDNTSVDGVVQGVLYGGSAMGFYRGGRVLIKNV